MSLLIRILAVCGVLLTLDACTEETTIVKESVSTTDAPDPDAVTLAELGEQAAQIARTSAAKEMALRQVFTDLNKTTFLFTDGAAMTVIYVHAPGSEITTDQWDVETDTTSQYIGRPSPGLELQTLTIGPGRAAQAIQDRWQGCELKSLTLYEESDTLSWRVFCETPQGWVAGNMDQRSGIFHPDEGAPFRPPSVATPSS